MSRQLHKLTTTQVKNATSSKAITKMGDGGGLTLVLKNDSKLWWFRYKFDGKAKTLSLGQYPQTSLAVARSLSEAARTLLSKHIDPQQHKKSLAEDKANESRNTFAAVSTNFKTSTGFSWGFLMPAERARTLLFDLTLTQRQQLQQCHRLLALIWKLHGQALGCSGPQASCDMDVAAEPTGMYSRRPADRTSGACDIDAIYMRPQGRMHPARAI